MNNSVPLDMTMRFSMMGFQAKIVNIPESMTIIIIIEGKNRRRRLQVSKREMGLLFN